MAEIIDGFFPKEQVRVIPTQDGNPRSVQLAVTDVDTQIFDTVTATTDPNQRGVVPPGFESAYKVIGPWLDLFVFVDPSPLVGSEPAAARVFVRGLPGIPTNIAPSLLPLLHTFTVAAGVPLDVSVRITPCFLTLQVANLGADSGNPNDEDLFVYWSAKVRSL